MTLIRWSRRSADDLQAIYDFAARDSERYAGFLVAKLVRAVDRLIEFPESGRVIPELSEVTIREIIVKPFRIVYRTKPECVEIVTIFRSSRLFPEVDV